MKILATWIIACGLATGCALANPPEAGGGAPAAHPQIGSHVVFQYYKDLAAAERFYGGTLGLRKTFDKEWVKIFEITPTLCRPGRMGPGDTTRPAQTTPAVMLSIETSDLEGWYAKLKEGNATFLKELGKASGNTDSPVDSILANDPGGYTVEMFRWKAKVT